MKPRSRGSKSEASNRITGNSQPQAAASGDVAASEFHRGWEARRDQEARSADEKKAREAEERDRRNSSIVVEFGDTTVTFRDGLDSVICRMVKENGQLVDLGWQGKLAELMVARGARIYECRIGEHCRFTIKQLIEQHKQRAATRAGGPLTQLWEVNE